MSLVHLSGEHETFGPVNGSRIHSFRVIHSEFLQTDFFFFY